MYSIYVKKIIGVNERITAQNNRESGVLPQILHSACYRLHEALELIKILFNLSLLKKSYFQVL